VHRKRHAPLFFGKTGDNRFDDPRGEYGVLYAGASEGCAFIETFGEPLDFPFVTRAQIDVRKLSEIELMKSLRLVDLSGEIAVALFDRARRFVRAHVANDTLGATSQRARLARLLDRYGLGLV
jgi:hypothetical protein